MNLVLYAIPLFLLAMLGEYLYGRARGRNTYRLNDTIASLQLGTLSRLRGVLQLGIGAAAYQALSNDYALLPLADDSALTWVVAFVAYDFCYYWSHRYGHEWRLFWASHVAHHQSEEFNLSTALRQTSTGYLTFVFYLPLYLLGLPPEVLVTVGSLNLIYQFWVHTEHVGRLGPVEWVLVTPSNHRVHHAKNPEYLDRNYGGVFILWDRLFRTFKDEEPDRPCVYGITRQLGSFNPVWANLHVYFEGLTDMLRTRHPVDAVKLWVKGPGWRPRDLSDTPRPGWQVSRYDPPIARFGRVYTFLQFWLAVAASFAVLLTPLERTETLSLAALLVFCFYVQGAWLDSRRYARALEWGRLTAVAAAAWLGVPVWGAQWSFVLTGYVAVCTIAMVVWATDRSGVTLTPAPGKEPAL